MNTPNADRNVRRTLDPATSSQLSTSRRKPDLNLELIEGELIEKSVKQRPHVNTLSLLYAHLITIFGSHFVNPGAPIDVAPDDNPTNEPEPDLIVLARDLSEFTSANPRPEDLRRVIEIAD